MASVTIDRLRSDRTRGQIQLTVRMARRQVAQRYTESLFGLAWSILNPLALLLIYWVVFTFVFKSTWIGPGEGYPFGLVIFSGLVFFYLYSEIVNNSTFLVQSNALLIKRTTLSARVLPLASMLASLFTFGLNLCAFLIMWALLERSVPPATMLLLPIVLVPLVVLCTGLGMIITSISAYFRDLQQVIPLVNTAVLFLSPVFFAISTLPARGQFLVQWLNPLGIILPASKELIFEGQIPPLAPIGLYSAVAVVLFAAGWFVYGRASRGFADVV